MSKEEKNDLIAQASGLDYFSVSVTSAKEVFGFCGRILDFHSAGSATNASDLILHIQ